MSQEALKQAVADIKVELQEVKDGVSRVIAALSQPDPDVEQAIADLKEIKAGFDEVESSMDAAVPPAPPAEPVA